MRGVESEFRAERRKKKAIKMDKHNLLIHGSVLSTPVSEWKSERESTCNKLIIHSQGDRCVVDSTELSLFSHIFLFAKFCQRNTYESIERAITLSPRMLIKSLTIFIFYNNGEEVSSEIM